MGDLKAETMKLWCTTKSIPELSKLPDKERKAIWRRCWAKASRTWKTVVEVFALLAVLFFCVGLSANTWGFWGGIIGGIIGGAVVGPIYAQLVIRKTMPYIREELNSHVPSSDSNERQ